MLGRYAKLVNIIIYVPWVAVAITSISLSMIGHNYGE